MLLSTTDALTSLQPPAGEQSFAKRMLAWYRQQNRSLPWRERFLQTGDPLAVWVSEIMLQQTTIQAVIPAYQRFFEHFPDIYGLSRASEAEVRLACRGLGYYRRFHFLHRAAQQLVAEAHPKVRWPQDFQGWRALPGVGDYTAAAISSIAFGVPKGVVDGNVERVLCRLLDLRIVVDPKWKKPFQSLMDSLVDPDSPGDFNQAMMELGQTVCTKQNPLCSKCPLQIVCRAYRNTSQDLAPQPKPAPTYEEVTLHVAIATHKGSVGLDHRLADARFLKGTLGFPCAIETSPRALLWETNYQFARSKKPFAKFKHSITKHKITGLVHNLGEFPHKDRSLTWIAWEELESQLVSNLDRKAWKSFVAQRGRD